MVVFQHVGLIRRFLDRTRLIGTGRSSVWAFTLLLLAELILGVTLGGLTPKEVFLNHDPVSGTAYYLSLCVFALMGPGFSAASVDAARLDHTEDINDRDSRRPCHGYRGRRVSR